MEPLDVSQLVLNTAHVMELMFLCMLLRFHLNFLSWRHLNDQKLQPAKKLYHVNSTIVGVQWLIQCLLSLRVSLFMQNLGISKLTVQTKIILSYSFIGFAFTKAQYMYSVIRIYHLLHCFTKPGCTYVCRLLIEPCLHINVPVNRVKADMLY